MRYAQMLSWIVLCMVIKNGCSFSPAPRRMAVNRPRYPVLALRAVSNSEIDDNTDDGPLVSQKADQTETLLVYLFPVVTAVSAFTFYESTSKGFHNFVETASQNKWYPVDGGALIGDIILPAINGPVLGTIGLLFATLVSTTIGNLYQRQVQISSSIVREVDDLRRLGYLLQSLPEPYRREAQMELKFFVNTIFEAARDRSVTDQTYRIVNLSPLFLLLNRISNDGVKDPSVKVSDNILGEGYTLIRRINDERTSIATLLRPAFPFLHYLNLVALGSCICLVFLIETDRNLIFFLAGFQLRLLWAILIGIFAMMATVIYDLESPFGGSYTVMASTDKELEILREYVTRSWED